MDLDFDPFISVLGWILLINKNVYTPQLITSRIHPNNSKKIYQSLSPSKVVTFLYIGTCLWFIHICMYIPWRQVWRSETRNTSLSPSSKWLFNQFTFWGRIYPPETSFSGFLLGSRNFHEITIEGQVVSDWVL